MLVNRSKSKEALDKTSSLLRPSSHHRTNTPMTSQDFIIHLQRSIGNQGLQRLMLSNVKNDAIKLKVSQPGDVYEQEADRVADQVMRTSPTDSDASTLSLREEDRIDCKCATCELEEDQGRLVPNVSRIQSNASNLEGPEEVAIEISNLRSTGGLPLDRSTKEFMEYRFGHDFSNVKIHTDDRATRTAASVNALAYTVGNDIVFGRGEYKPSTAEGRRNLAHELTHVVQQQQHHNYHHHSPVQAARSTVGFFNSGLGLASPLCSGKRFKADHLLALIGLRWLNPPGHSFTILIGL